MNIKSNHLYSEMQSMLSEMQGDTQPLQRTQQLNNTQSEFGTLLRDAVNNINELQSDARDLQTRLEMGDRSVSLAEAMIAAQKSSIAFEAGVQVRNKVVDAYEKIMNMPV